MRIHIPSFFLHENVKSSDFKSTILLCQHSQHVRMQFLVVCAAKVVAVGRSVICRAVAATVCEVCKYFHRVCIHSAGMHTTQPRNAGLYRGGNNTRQRQRNHNTVAVPPTTHQHHNFLLQSCIDQFCQDKTLATNYLHKRRSKRIQKKSKQLLRWLPSVQVLHQQIKGVGVWENFLI